jgi:hypothetical protein
VTGARQNESLTALERFLEPLFDRDPSGRSWLPALLDAAPHGRTTLGELVDEPGGLEIALAVRGVSGRRATFDYIVPPPRGLLAWFIDHPDALEWPSGAELSPETAILRRALINDDPPGSRARAQDRARERLATAAPLLPDWWRFEEVTRPGAVLATGRLVLLLEGSGPGARCERPSWYPPRSRLLRVGEAAKQLAHGRRWATLVLGGEPLEEPPDDPGRGALKRMVDRGAPHLSAAERDELHSSYLGTLSLGQAAAAVGIPAPAATLDSE